jgi:hypothetical protein
MHAYGLYNAYVYIMDMHALYHVHRIHTYTVHMHMCTYMGIHRHGMAHGHVGIDGHGYGGEVT